MFKMEHDVEKCKTKKACEEKRNGGKILAVLLVAIALVIASVVAWYFQEWQLGIQLSAALIVLFILVFYWRWMYVAALTAPRDIRALWYYVKILRLARKLKTKNWTVPDILHQQILKHPDKACFLFEDETWTFSEVEEYSLRISSALKSAGDVSAGHIVGLMVGNCPELCALWVGAGRLGAVSALINTNQTGDALVHSIKVAKCSVLVYGTEFSLAIKDIKNQLDPSMKTFCFTRRQLFKQSKETTSSGDDPNFGEILENTKPISWFPSDGDGFNGRLLYIYTSGTTGLPKAAIISNARMIFMASGIHYCGRLRRDDVVYCPMPLYHSAGCCISLGQALIFGCTVALRAKFSASAYFPDCIKFKATVAHYIGEMCRYVLATAQASTDTQHTVHTVFGNGMRPNIWLDFVKRFNIKRVVEFYGATEGNANIVNIDNKTGSVGFISRIIPAAYPIAIIKADQDSGEPIRNSKGLCQLAKADEPGVFIGKINPANPSRAYLGYVDKEASEKKIVKDVFTYGDSAFISGDILVADELGYLYFRDRTGDTFRWRGENVSTAEVEATVSHDADHRDVVVYGVQIPNIEGRAGMCGIVDSNDDLDLNELASRINKSLAMYARPVFLRILKNIDMTGTYKLKKAKLQKEGYDPTIVKDKLYYYSVKLGKYLELGTNEYDKITKAQIRL